MTAQIVQDNRVGEPERVIDVVEERAPGGFAHLDEVASHAELEAIVKDYSKTAGYDQTQVNPKVFSLDRCLAQRQQAREVKQ